MALSSKIARERVLAHACLGGTEAIERDPSLIDSASKPHRYSAACAAALVAGGRDASLPETAQRANHRQRAIAWLTADLAATRAALANGTRAKDAVVRELEFWQRDPDLRAMRDPALVATYPEADRTACRRLWRTVDAVLASVRE